jgi:putative glutamine amidotransferase
LPAIPLIAVAGAVEQHQEETRLSVPTLYLDALERAGGFPAVLHPRRLVPGVADHRLDPFAGLVLTGGGDIDPSFYGQDPDPHLYGVDPVRDEFEIGLVHAAFERGIPVLAICRGLQVLNVALGGTLDQHIVGKTSESHGVPGGGAPVVHPVRLEPGSRLFEIMGVEVAQSSCHHHQAIASLGKGLHPVAWAGDVIEAVEGPQRGVIAVQWHPEDTAADDTAQQRLFDALLQRTLERQPGASGNQPVVSFLE